jgi:hypothetical protein
MELTIVRRELTGIFLALAMSPDHNTPIKGHFWESFNYQILSMAFQDKWRDFFQVN